MVVEDLEILAFLRATTSSAVYSSGPPAVPWNSVSVLVKGPTVINGASSAVLGSWYGVV